MTYHHECLSCGCRIGDPEDEELVPGTHDPVRYRHKDYTGCSEALNTKPTTPVRATVRKRATLEQIEDRPDNPWTRRK